MFTCRVCFVASVVLFSLGFAADPVLSAPSYTITNLGTLPAPFDSSSHAYAINDNGVIVGDSQALLGGMHAIRSAPRSPFTFESDLGTGGGFSSQAFGIN